VSRIQRSRKLNGYVQRFNQLHSTAGKALAQRLPINELGGNEMPALILFDFEDGDDVWMADPRGCLRLPYKSLHQLWVSGEFLSQKLERDLASQS